MAKKTWILTDVDQDLYVERLTLTPSDVGGPAAGYTVTKRRLRGGLREGVNVIEVDNGRFRFVVVPTRGMGIWRAEQDDVLLGWKSPVKGPVHPAFVRLQEASGIGWLDGFDELLVRCGLESNGAPEKNADGTLRYGLHGKIANLPAHQVQISIDGDAGEIAVTGTVDEARMFGNKLRLTSTVTTQVGQSGLTITDRVTNLSAEPARVGTSVPHQFRRTVGGPWGEGRAAGEPDGPARPRGRREPGRVGHLRAVHSPARRKWSSSSSWRPLRTARPGPSCTTPPPTGA